MTAEGCGGSRVGSRVGIAPRPLIAVAVDPASLGVAELRETFAVSSVFTTATAVPRPGVAVTISTASVACGLGVAVTITMRGGESGIRVGGGVIRCQMLMMPK